MAPKDILFWVADAMSDQFVKGLKAVDSQAPCSPVRPLCVVA